MTSKTEQLKLRLSLATPFSVAEVKMLLKDLYEQIDQLQNEIRKISENRPRPNTSSGKSL